MQQGKPGTPLVYEVFDVLEIDGRPVVDEPLTDRRERLEALLDARVKNVQVSGFFDDGDALMTAATAQSLEGVMAKRPSSLYLEGKRTRDWLKIKTHGRQEFVICGWTKGQGRRAGRFGALVLGAYRGTDLHWVGNCGTGFDEQTIDALIAKLKPLVRETSPLVEVPKMPKIRKGDVTWVEPELVCEVRFAEWTHDGHLRAPVFEGLRDDKAARDVRREDPVETVESRVKLSNLDKIFWPDEGITKGDLIDYYRAVADVLVPHLRGPAVHDAPLSRRCVRQGVLPERRAVAHARLDPTVPRAGLDARVAAAHEVDRGAARERRGRASLDGQHGLHRHEHVVLARRPARPPGLRALRSRPVTRRRLQGDGAGRARREGGARRARARLVPEDLERRGDARARAGRASLHLRRHARVLARSSGARSRERIAASRRPNGRSRSGAAC